MMRIMRIFAELLNLIRSDQSDWKILEYLKATFCGSSSSCDCKYHWPEFFRNRFLFNLLSNSMQMLISFRYFKIFIRAVRIKKRSTVSHLHDIFTETFQEINSSCNTCILSKCDKSTVILISDFFVINQSYFLFQHLVQSWHVMRLGFNCVRKEHVSCVGNKLFNWHLFDSENKVTSGKILTDNGSLLKVLVI